MPRSARLTNIANGLCGAFASRNNDLAGYWAIGKLRSLADRCSTSTVSLDLLALSIQPPSSEFGQLLADYQRLLQKLASRSGVPLDAIHAATMSVDFLPRPWSRAIHCQQHWGEQFLLTVTIRGDGRADGIMRHGGYCRPHDPTRERCRGGC